MKSLERALGEAVQLLESPTADNVLRAAGALEDCGRRMSPENAGLVKVYLGRLRALLDAALRTRLACAKQLSVEAMGYTSDGTAPALEIHRRIEIEA
jgi:hypothetical protein